MGIHARADQLSEQLLSAVGGPGPGVGVQVGLGQFTLGVGLHHPAGGSDDVADILDRADSNTLEDFPSPLCFGVIRLKGFGN